jgi:hypothetical protein
MKKIFIIAIVVVLLVLGIRFFGGEDNWICQDGQWIKHGNPSSLVPDTECKNSTDNKLELYSDLTERENVESYLRNNINTLSPVKTVLGGTWYILVAMIDIEKKSGIVTYEDGHIQEKKNFTYSVNEKREVINLTIN